MRGGKRNWAGLLFGLCVGGREQALAQSEEEENSGLWARTERERVFSFYFFFYFPFLLFKIHFSNPFLKQFEMCLYFGQIHTVQ